ncbi:transposase [Corynebacterium diphtheriae]|nr:transposase [Corynebacterium diphtheriae] [Corynebacterium diphtheriae subsp. lausannense]
MPRVLFLGICLDFYYYLRRVLLPKFGFHFTQS